MRETCIQPLTLKNVIHAVRDINKRCGNAEEEIPYFALHNFHGGREGHSRQQEQHVQSP